MKKYILPNRFEEDFSTKNLLTEEDIQDLADRYSKFMENPESRSKEERDYLLDKAFEYGCFDGLSQEQSGILRTIRYWLSRPQEIKQGLVEPEPVKKYSTVFKNWLGL